MVQGKYKYWTKITGLYLTRRTVTSGEGSSLRDDFSYAITNNLSLFRLKKYSTPPPKHTCMITDIQSTCPFLTSFFTHATFHCSRSLQDLNCSLNLSFSYFQLLLACHHMLDSPAKFRGYFFKRLEIEKKI